MDNFDLNYHTGGRLIKKVKLGVVGEHKAEG